MIYKREKYLNKLINKQWNGRIKVITGLRRCGKRTILFEEIYFKDIEERYDIRLPGVLRELTSSLCSSIGSLTNASKIARTVQTMKNGYLDWVFMIFFWMNPAWTDKLIIAAHREQRRDRLSADT